MKITNIQNLTTNNNISKFTELSFKSEVTQDSFQGNTRNTYETYHKKLQESPEIAFIYDPEMSIVDKIKLLNKKPNILSASQIGAKINIGGMYWAHPKCFKIEYFERSSTGESCRKYATPLIDTANPLNKKPLEVIQNLPKSAISTEKFSQTYRIPKELLTKYIAKGYVELITLPSLETGEEVPINVINTATPKNVAFIKKYKEALKRKLNSLA